jgi:Tol biopolymer transport system component
MGDELHPTVSPDGRYVAYVADDAGRRTLRIRRFDGGGDRKLLDSGDGLLPVW